MKTILFAITFLLCSFLIQAQTNNTPVVSIDRMNVLYLGIDNPVSIYSPADFSNTTVEMTNGTVSGSGTHRIIRPAAIGQSTMTITANGLSTSVYFRVKRIPDPVFKVGSGNSILSVDEFIAQQVCRAEMIQFDFDLRYKVQSATVLFSGTNFPTPVTQKINGNSLASLADQRKQCQPGTVVTFSDIMVTGPDGVRKIDDRTYTLF
ncbi:MAG: GldM family protein [Ferruginibacter sp.]